MPKRPRGTSKSPPSMSVPCWCCSTDGAACSATASFLGALPWRKRPGRSSRPTPCRDSSRRSAGMRPKARPSSAPASSIMSSGRRARSAGAWRCSMWRPGGESASYFMPLALAWEDRDEERLRNISTAAIAKVRQQASVGVMGDAFADEAFCRAVVGAMHKPRDMPTAQGKLEFRPTAAFGRLAGKNFAALPAARPQGSSSNTVVVMGERLILKGYRRLRVGKSPELEMGLFLTDVVHYAHCAAVAGVLEYRDKDGAPRLLAMLQKYVANQGDGWTYALEYLRRYLEVHRTTPATDALPANAHEAFLALMRRLAVRTGELHLALATTTGDPLFDPEGLGRVDFEVYRQRAAEEAKNALALLKQHLEELTPAEREQAGAILARQDQIQKRIEALAAAAKRGTKIRIHGDYHLGQVLLTKN